MQFILSILVLALAVGGLALGVLFGRPPLQGSCGGDGACEVCQGNHACQNQSRPPVLPE